MISKIISWGKTMAGINREEHCFITGKRVRSTVNGFSDRTTEESRVSHVESRPKPVSDEGEWAVRPSDR